MADGVGQSGAGDQPQEKPRRLNNPPWTSETAPRNGGRPKGSVSIVEKLRRHLEENPKDVADIVATAIDGAKAGDQKLLSIILDRIDGPVKQHIEHSGALDVTSAFLQEKKEAPLDGDTAD